MTDLTDIKVSMARTEEQLLAIRDDTGNIKERIAKLESNQLWVVRTVIGAVIAGVLGLIGLKTGIMLH